MTDSEQRFDEDTLEEKRNEFNEKMKAYKEQFYANYVKPNGTIDQKYTTQELIDNELKRISTENRKKLEGCSTIYTDDKIENTFNEIPGEQNLFQPQLQGLSKVYTLSSKEAIDQLDARAKFLNQESGATGDDHSAVQKFAKNIDTLLEQAKKTVSATQTVIDINKKEGFDLLATVAEFFDTGLNGSACKVFNALGDVEFNNINLRSSIIYANSNNNNQRNRRYLIRFVYVMLVNLQCSNLIRQLNFDNDFLRTHYFYDAPIRDPFVAELIASKIEQIERYQIEGELDEKKSKDFTPPVEGKLFAKRVEETVNQYLNTIRIALLEDTNIGIGQLNQLHLPQLVVIFKLVAQTFLTQTSGEVASMGNLWDVFKNIASQDNITGSNFQLFQNILKKKEVTSSFNSKTRVWHALVEIYNSKILAEIPVWGVNSKNVRSIKEPAYYHDSQLCKLISIGLNPFRFPTIKIDYDDLMEYVDDDE